MPATQTDPRPFLINKALRAQIDAMTAPEMAVFVRRQRGGRSMDAQIEAQATETYKSTSAKFDRLVLALRAEVKGKERGIRNPTFMSWQMVIDHKDDSKLLIIVLDAAASSITVTLREVGQPDQASTLAAGLSYTAIARACDAILNA